MRMLNVTLKLISDFNIKKIKFTVIFISIKIFMQGKQSLRTSVHFYIKYTLIYIIQFEVKTTCNFSFL